MRPLPPENATSPHQIPFRKPKLSRLAPSDWLERRLAAAIACHRQTGHDIEDWCGVRFDGHYDDYG